MHVAHVPVRREDVTPALAAASIAHELSQPLTGILTSASMCVWMLDADPPNLDAARQAARRTLRDGTRASDVIAQLRALFLRQEITPGGLDLNEAIRAVIEESVVDLQRASVVLESDLADDLPRVAGDRVQLQQVISNLLRNAADAMVGIHDRPHLLRVRTDWDGADQVRVTVRDAGVGIDRDRMQRLFDAFTQRRSAAWASA